MASKTLKPFTPPKGTGLSPLTTPSDTEGVVTESFSPKSKSMMTIIIMQSLIHYIDIHMHIFTHAYMYIYLHIYKKI
jgi:hypothetical protein